MRCLCLCLMPILMFGSVGSAKPVGISIGDSSVSWRLDCEGRACLDVAVRVAEAMRGRSRFLGLEDEWLHLHQRMPDDLTLVANGFLFFDLFRPSRAEDFRADRWQTMGRYTVLLWLTWNQLAKILYPLPPEARFAGSSEGGVFAGGAKGWETPLAAAGDSSFSGECSGVLLPYGSDGFPQGDVKGAAKVLIESSFLVPEDTEKATIAVNLSGAVQISVNGQDVSGGFFELDAPPRMNNMIFRIPKDALKPGENKLAVLVRALSKPLHLDLEVRGCRPCAVGLDTPCRGHRWKPSVRVGRLHGFKGDRAYKRHMRLHLRKRIPPVARCFSEHGDPNVDQTKRRRLRFEVRLDGRTGRPRARPRGEVFNKPLAACIRKQFRRWELPTPKNKKDFQFQLTYHLHARRTTIPGPPENK